MTSSGDGESATLNDKYPSSVDPNIVVANPLNKLMFKTGSSIKLTLNAQDGTNLEFARLGAIAVRNLKSGPPANRQKQLRVRVLGVFRGGTKMKI